MMGSLERFSKEELKVVEDASSVAEDLVSRFYVLSPRERARMNYEVCTLDNLAPEEICHQAFAQVLCYDCVKQIGAMIIEHQDLYRICLQDHRILPVTQKGASSNDPGKFALEALLLYVLTHELVHIVRFSQHLQRVDLARELRSVEELSVEQTTSQILAPVADRALRQVIAVCTS